MSYQFVQILGIKFYNGLVEGAFNFLKENGGLMTVPAAPALVTIKDDKSYYNSLLNSDIVIPDSGYMVLIWNFLYKNKLKKISGLEFINHFLSQNDRVNQGKLFLINPSELDGQINTQYLNNAKFDLEEAYNYTAPFYKKTIIDVDLLDRLEEKKPKWILINIGGGTQEKLGLYLKENLSYKPAILCTGAAIAFKTGRQGKMPTWMDQIYLGWLHRCFSNPKIFIPRYLKGFKLIKIILHNKSSILK
ncbi:MULTISPECIES: WecB/TagA/CpsF family glycosyltransferase [Flavobacterium]|uniref:WecB/TagA/CpsF family glycosyltransferase n=1 Tax=Flavobacterium jumunjinense TaxID=998845 RepID=A0ABV5GQY0_9FLAO|nr:MULTISPECIES: WecB/TagA/CpsF family glycosyltransferase [Flavobacterium]